MQVFRGDRWQQQGTAFRFADVCQLQSARRMAGGLAISRPHRSADRRWVGPRFLASLCVGPLDRRRSVVIAVRAQFTAESPPRTHCGDLAEPPSALTPLCHQPNWVIWRWVKDRSGRWTKPPFCADHPSRLAANNDNRTWATHRMAVAAVLAGHAHGIG